MLHAAGIVVVIALLLVAFVAATGQGGAPLVARLGDVLYWGACLMAGVLALIAAYAMAFGTGGEDRAFIDTGLAGLAVIVWLVGRACRYVLAGR